MGNFTYAQAGRLFCRSSSFKLAKNIAKSCFGEVEWTKKSPYFAIKNPLIVEVK
jgi:hypothetical protein